MDLAALEQRLARLEDDRAIRDLKARYLRACDAKDVGTLRETLLPDGAVIAFDGADHALGQWSLLFHSINLANRTITQMGVEYEDVYVKQNGRWWIAETRSQRRSCLIHAVDESGSATVSSMGEPPATFG